MSSGNQSNDYTFKSQRYTYRGREDLGVGSFGVVTKAHCVELNDEVAIKRVLQDPRYKNRELDMMLIVRHPNVVGLLDYYYTDSQEARENERFLNLAMEYVPDTLHTYLKRFYRQGVHVPILNVKSLAYQMLRALGYLHHEQICHRDIKPQNVLVDERKGILKICDFGSAKSLKPGEASVAYICSRYYRAPELMMGAQLYDNDIDAWSVGCVLAEFFLHHPLFPGESPVDQLVKVVQKLGTPSRQDLADMGVTSNQTASFPLVQPVPWASIIPAAPADALDLLSKLLVYSPKNRLGCYEALAHPFFDDLRAVDQAQRFQVLVPGEGGPNSRPSTRWGAMGPLFDFSEKEVKIFKELGIYEKVIPKY